MEPKLYSIRRRWRTFKPHLDNPDVKTALAGCLGFSSLEEYEKDPIEPWTMTTTDYWVRTIWERIERDPAYRKDERELVALMYGPQADIEDDDLYCDFVDTPQYQILYGFYHAKHEPKPGTHDWYLWRRSCYFITPFTAQLIASSIPRATDITINTSEKHSFVSFKSRGQLFYADLLIEWESVSELLEFTGEIRERICNPTRKWAFVETYVARQANGRSL